jgi:outer membrane protein OmpA-like peptidoglycan-associated protein
MKTTACVMLLVVLFVFSGCASVSKRKKCIVASAAAGAVMGGGAGVIIGNQGDTDNRVEGSLIGTGAGALVGGLLGLLICKEEVPAVVEAEEPPPEPEEVVTPPEIVPEKPEIVEKIVLNALRFDFDSAAIKPEFFPALDEAVSILQKHTEKKIVVEGHTCWVGTEEYNANLSLRRAQSVQKYLVEKGIAPDSLTVKGYGEENPVADNSSNEGRRMNRRVEFKVMDDE